MSPPARGGRQSVGEHSKLYFSFLDLTSQVSPAEPEGSADGELSWILKQKHLEVLLFPSFSVKIPLKRGQRVKRHFKRHVNPGKWRHLGQKFSHFNLRLLSSIPELYRLRVDCQSY